MSKCVQCAKEFEITSKDALFYEKIQVPHPTHCPDCRYQRRIAIRNERNLYPNVCCVCERNIVSIHASDSGFKVACNECWYSDKVDGKEHGRDFDFSRPFFEQYAELQRIVPRLYVFASKNENSEFTNGSSYNKNCYMTFVSDHNEETHYSYAVYDCKNVLDCINAKGIEFSYELSGCSNANSCQYSIDCHNCSQVYFSVDCVGCHDCFGCSNLRNKSFCYFNEQLTEEAYKEKIKQHDLGSYEVVTNLWETFKEEVISKAIYQRIHGVNIEGSSGDYLKNVKDSKVCFECNDNENCAYITHGNHAKDNYDGYVVVDGSELNYEAVGMWGNNCHFVYIHFGDDNNEYCDSIVSSSNCFGCVGLKREQYCIFNKQYTKEEYEALKQKIIDHMKQTGEYGEYFPITLSPFAYNETAAQEYFPMTKEEVLAKGWKWKDNVAGTYGKETLKADQIADHINNVETDILKEVLACIDCQKNYRLVPQEFAFYKKQGIPIPRKCFDCRHITRLSMRNPRKLWQSQCTCIQDGHEHTGRCSTTFETTYDPGRPEKVYCEECYRKEVY